MKNFFIGLWNDNVLSCILTVIAGVLITVFHAVAMNIVCVALGLFCAVLGVINIIKNLLKADPASRFNLLFGLILAFLGLYIVFEPTVLINFVAVTFGIIILFHGITQCQDTARLKKANYKFWYVSLIFSLLTLLAGFLLIVLKDRLVNSLAILLGIILIIEGALNIWITVKVKKIND